MRTTESASPQKAEGYRYEINGQINGHCSFDAIIVVDKMFQSTGKTHSYLFSKTSPCLLGNLSKYVLYYCFRPSFIFENIKCL